MAKRVLLSELRHWAVENHYGQADLPYFREAFPRGMPVTDASLQKLLTLPGTLPGLIIACYLDPDQFRQRMQIPSRALDQAYSESAWRHRGAKGWDKGDGVDRDCRESKMMYKQAFRKVFLDMWEEVYGNG